MLLIKKTCFYLLVTLFIILGSHTSNAQWTQLNLPSDLSYNCVEALGTTIFISGDGGRNFRSTDDGTTWVEITNALSKNISSFAKSGTNIFAGVGDWANAGVFISTDNGTIWTENGLNVTWVFSFTTGGSNIFVTTKEGVFRSTNNGSDWIDCGLPGEYEVFPIAFNGLYIFASPIMSGEHYRSFDLGSSWTTYLINLENSYIFSFAIIGSKIFAATGGGIYLSTNHGTIWNSVFSTPNFWGDHLASIGTYIFAGGYISTGSGSECGVFVSTNNGVSWNDVRDGLLGQIINITHMSANSTYLFIIGQDLNFKKVVWRRPLSEMITSVQLLSNDLPKHFNLEQNCPNPFNPTTSIEYSVKSEQFVTLKVYDILGNEIETLVNQEKPKGTYKVIWHAANQPSGVYFYQLHAGNYVETKKMILMK